MTSLTQRIAYIPECRPDALSPRWLDWLQEIGYTGIYIEPDPFQPPRSGNISMFHNLYRLISLYDLAWGDERQRLREWIDRACELCRDRDMTVHLALWEPRLPGEAWGVFPEEWKGRGSFDQPPGNTISWCMSHEEARAAYQQMATEAFAAIPKIDGLKMGLFDNDAHLCKDVCPRCKDTPRGELMVRVFRHLLAAATESGLDRPGFDYTLYVWWWKEEELDCVAELFAEKRVTILGRLSEGLSQTWKGETLPGWVADLSLGTPGIGNGYMKMAEKANARGWDIVDMPGFGHTIEYFWQPYTPAPWRVANILSDLHDTNSAGWHDYDCGGVYPGINTEIVKEEATVGIGEPEAMVATVLDRLYPWQERDAAESAYRLAEEALKARPIAYNAPGVMNISGRSTIEGVIGMPFDPGHISGFDQFHRTSFHDPANFLTNGSIEIMQEMHTASAKKWQAAWKALAPLNGSEEWQETLAFEKTVFQAHMLVSASAARYTQMAANRLARGRGVLTAKEEAKRLIPLLQAELEATCEFEFLWLKDHRLLDNANIRYASYLQAMRPWYTFNPTNPFPAKVDQINELLKKIEEERFDTVPPYTTAEKE